MVWAKVAIFAQLLSTQYVHQVKVKTLSNQCERFANSFPLHSHVHARGCQKKGLLNFWSGFSVNLSFQPICFGITSYHVICWLTTWDWHQQTLYRKLNLTSHLSKSIRTGRSYDCQNISFYIRRLKLALFLSRKRLVSNGLVERFNELQLPAVFRCNIQKA